MKDIMLDIETLGLDEKCAVIQIAAVYFDIETGKQGLQFDECLHIGELVEEGFKIDQSTLDWWKKQDQDVFQNILVRGKSVQSVIKGFSDFIQYEEDVCFWSHATFDFVVLQNYLKHFKHEPMNHRKAMDIRTLCFLSGIDLDKYDWSNKTHNAIDDCLFQIQYCCDAYQMLKYDPSKHNKATS